MARLAEVGDALFPLSPVGRAFVSLHNNAASNWAGPLRPLPAPLRPLCRLLGANGFADYRQARAQAGAGLDPRVAAVAFSGGRDSVAAALKLVDAGYAVRLFHVYGLNPASAQREYKAATALAGALGLPLVFTTIAYSGKALHAENPAKNCLVLGLMVENAEKLGWAGVYTLGTMETDRIGKAGQVSTTVGVSDYVDVLEAAMAGIQKMRPGVVLRTVLKSNTDSFLTVYRKRRDLFPAISSCLFSEHLKFAHRKRIIQTYGVDLMPGRCGCCYKCAGEWLLLRAAGEVRDNRPYQDYCVERLQASVEQFWKLKMSRWQAVDFFIDRSALPFAKGFA